MKIQAVHLFQCEKEMYGYTLYTTVLLLLLYLLHDHPYLLILHFQYNYFHQINSSAHLFCVLFCYRNNKCSILKLFHITIADFFHSDTNVLVEDICSRDISFANVVIPAIQDS